MRRDLIDFSRRPKWPTVIKKAICVNADQTHLPISQVAADMIGRRLARVRKYMPLAADHWRDNLERVHQLRVATRRATAALRTFEGLMPSRRTAKLKKLLRTLRRAAGEARDLDVLSARLRDESDKSGRQVLRDVLQRLGREREQSQSRIKKAVAKLRRKRFKRKCNALVERVRWRLPTAEPTYEEAAGAMLRGPVDDFFKAAAADLSTTCELHALRIAGKRLRYAMELLAGALDEGCRDDLYVQIRALQERLGRLNDRAVAVNRLRELSKIAEQPAAQRELQVLADKESAALVRERLAFLDDWTRQQRQELQESLGQFTGT